MSVFTALPQDMLQWEINRFLTHKDALNWNEVLKKDERVFKKFPKDYAIRHQIKLSYENYQEIAWKLQISLNRVEVAGYLNEMHAPNSVKLLKKYFAFFKDPKNHVVLMYTQGLKGSFLQSISQWTEEDIELYEYLSEPDVKALRDDASETVNIIADISFLRNVPVKDHQNAFAA